MKYKIINKYIFIQTDINILNLKVKDKTLE